VRFIDVIIFTRGYVLLLRFQSLFISIIRIECGLLKWIVIGTVKENRSSSSELARAPVCVSGQLGGLITVMRARCWVTVFSVRVCSQHVNCGELNLRTPTEWALTVLVSLQPTKSWSRLTRKTNCRNVSCNVQIPLDAPGQILSLIGSGRVVPKFHYTEPTRPDPRTAQVSGKSADFVWS